ncbi:MAG: LAGLIDADG family homing endonuclease, partial [Candidatus Nanohaloarchaea archaeon]
YDVEEKEDLVGELVIGLAPHTSGGTVGRIIGFTDAKGIYSHPYWHAAKRRNCLPGDTEVKMADGTSKSLKEIYASAEDEKTTDSTGTREKEISKEVISIDEGSVADSKASKVIKTPAQDHKIEIKTESGRKLQTFPDHRLKTSEGVKRAREVEKDDNLLVPAKMPVEAENAGSLDLLELVGEDYMLRGISETTDRLIKDLGGLENASQALGIAREALENYRHGDSVPKETLDELADRASIDIEIGNCAIADKGDKIELERYVEVDSEFMRLLGYYLAGGYTRKSEKDGEQVYQVRFAYGEKELKNSIRSLIETVFEVEPSEGDNVLAVSSRAIYELFKSFGAASEAHEKRVPEFAKKLPEDKISEMLSAYFSGDGSVEKGRLHVQATNVSRGLLQDVDTLLKRFGIYARYSQSERKGGGILVENYGKEKNKGRTFVSHKLHIRSSDARKFGEEIGFDLETKQSDLEYSYEKIRKPEEHRRNGVVMEKVQSVEVKRAKERFMYDLEVEDTHNFVTSDNIVTNNCDGDEDAILLLMDGLLNFSRQFLPDITGARTMDAPLILSTVLNPDEIDDEAWAIETVSEYPLEFYEETLDYKPPWELETDIEIGEDVVYGDEPFSHGYTHESRDVENAPNQSEYVTLDEMSDKTKSQLGLGRKIKAVDADDTAELLLKKHFIPDIKGNLRSFSSQEMRCVDCNEKFRRVPLRSQTIAPTGKTTAECPECEGKVLLTISEGTIKKYMRPSEDIIDEYEISPYVRQQILILKQTLQSLFGKEKRQSGLKQFT